MVRLARAELFDSSEVAILHVIGRVTRRCFLFEFDPVLSTNNKSGVIFADQQMNIPVDC